jgi:hypothetical protein
MTKYDSKELSRIARQTVKDAQAQEHCSIYPRPFRLRSWALYIDGEHVRIVSTVEAADGRRFDVWCAI